VGFNVLNPCIFGIVLPLLCELKQHVETGEVLVMLDYSSGLFSVKDSQLVDRRQEPIREVLFFFTKPNLRDVSPRTSVLFRATHSYNRMLNLHGKAIVELRVKYGKRKKGNLTRRDCLLPRDINHSTANASRTFPWEPPVATALQLRELVIIPQSALGPLSDCVFPAGKT
jgi:hypothetical protein